MGLEFEREESIPPRQINVLVSIENIACREQHPGGITSIDKQQKLIYFLY